MVVPLVPLMLGSVGMLVSAYLRGAEALVVTFGLTIVGLLVWRVADGLAGAARDLSASALVAFYPIFLGGFASLMLSEDDGRQRIVVFILVTVFSDIGGYAVGVKFGRHPMAPSLSPKKSWEGFAGSVLSCAAVGAISSTSPMKVSTGTEMSARVTVRSSMTKPPCNIRLCSTN